MRNAIRQMFYLEDEFVFDGNFLVFSISKQYAYHQRADACFYIRFPLM